MRRGSMYNMYVVTLRHDKGKIRIKTVATSKVQAARIVCDYERAPHYAVVAIRKIDK